MVAANQADFFGDSAPGTVFQAFGGLTERTVAQVQRQAANDAAAKAATVAAAARLKSELAASNAAKAAKFVADQKEAAKHSGSLLGDLKALGKGALSTAGTLAKVAGTIATVVPGGQLIGAALIAAGAGASALSKGDVKGAVVAGVSAALPAVKAIEPVAAAIKDAKAIVDTAKAALPVVQTLKAASVVDQLIKAGPVNAAAIVPALKSLAGDAAKNAAGLSVLADKVLAAKELGGSLGAQATAIISETNRLAAAGDASARLAVKALADVAAARLKAGLSKGAEQVTTTTGATAAAAYIASAAGLSVALPSVVVVRSVQPKAAFAAAAFTLPPRTQAVASGAGATAGKALQTGFAGASVPAVLAAAAVKPPAPAAARAELVKAPAALPAPAKPAAAGFSEQGFVLTVDARVLDGTQWSADETGSDGFFVRTSGPAALRRDATVRRWKRV